MILSLVAIILLALAVGGWLYLDTRYQHRAQRWSRHEANLVIHDERIAEAEKEDAEQDRSEADYLLLNEVTDEEPDTANEPRSFVLQVIGSVLVCVLGFLGYLLWGDLYAPALERVTQQFEELPNLDPEQRTQELEKIISRLEQRNNSRHRSVASVDYLIVVYSLIRDFDGIIRIHKQAETDNMTSVMSDLKRFEAEVLINNDLTADAQRVAQRVLVEVPDHPRIMQLYGFFSSHEREFSKARNFLERGIRKAEDESTARDLEDLVNQVNEQLDETHVGIRLSVDVQIESESDLWLTVFAQTEESEPPVAVIQRPFVRKKRYDIILDDAVAMLPQTLLSDASRVRVVARLTPTQSILSTNAVQEVSSGWLDPATLPRVSLSLTDIATDDGISISVALGAGITAEDEATVFIIGRAVASSDEKPPLIVKRVRKRDLPLDVVLTVEDAMLPLERLPDDGLEVYARLSRTGNTTRAQNDVESNRAQVQVGQSIRLTLDKVIREVDLNNVDSETGS